MALARVISISILGLLVLQDFRKREVSVWTYYMLGACILFDKYLCQDLAFFYTDFVINQSCVLILVISIWGYALSRCCKLEDVIGKGDLWFFEILAISFYCGGFSREVKETSRLLGYNRFVTLLLSGSNGFNFFRYNTINQRIYGMGLSCYTLFTRG